MPIGRDKNQPALLFTSPASALQRLKLFIHRKALQEPRWGKLGSTFRGPAHLAEFGMQNFALPQNCRNSLALNFTRTLLAPVSIYTSLATGSAAFKKTTQQQNFRQTFLFPSPLPPCEVMATWSVARGHTPLFLILNPTREVSGNFCLHMTKLLFHFFTRFFFFNLWMKPLHLLKKNFRLVFMPFFVFLGFFLL